MHIYPSPTIRNRPETLERVRQSMMRESIRVPIEEEDIPNICCELWRNNNKTEELLNRKR